jgi:hypothetical protein
LRASVDVADEVEVGLAAQEGQQAATDDGVVVND